MGTRTLRILCALFAITLLATACGSENGTETETETAASTEPDEHSHDHSSTIEVDGDLPIPGVEIALTETSTAGLFDVSISLTNFTITEENVDGDPIDNEGHMHLLIDGEKIERLFDLETQISVPAGEHLVEVELNANNHSAYAVDGVPIRAGETVTGAGEPSHGADEHDHDHSHDHGSSGPAIEEGLAVGDEDISITASLTGGAVQVDGDDRVEASVGQVVLIVVDSDTDEEVHVHGYDLLAPVGPDAPATILFTADTQGKFEVEFEGSGAFIVELVVS